MKWIADKEVQRSVGILSGEQGSVSSFIRSEMSFSEAHYVEVVHTPIHIEYTSLFASITYKGSN